MGIVHAEAQNNDVRLFIHHLLNILHTVFSLPASHGMIAQLNGASGIQCLQTVFEQIEECGNIGLTVICCGGLAAGENGVAVY